MKKLLAVGVIIVLMAVPSMLLGQNIVGEGVTPHGHPFTVYHIEEGTYQALFHYTQESLEILVTFNDSGGVVILIGGDDVFSSDPPHSRWTWHKDTGDESLDTDSFGHFLCAMVATHFLKRRGVTNNEQGFSSVYA